MIIGGYMETRTYKELGIGAGINFIIALFGGFLFSKYFFIYDYDGSGGQAKPIGYYLGIILNVFTIVGIILLFYFCLKIIIKAFKDIRNNIDKKVLISIIGFLSSFVLIIMALISEYSLGLLYHYVRGKFSIFIAALFDIPSYIGVLAFIYFYFSYIIHSTKEKNCELENYKKLEIKSLVSFIVALFSIMAPKIFYPYLEKDRYLSIYIEYFFGKILVAFSFIGIVMVFYFSIKIIMKSFIDIRKNVLDKSLICIYGFLSSFLLLILISICQDIIVGFLLVRISFYIDVFICMYFYFKYLFCR